DALGREALLGGKLVVGPVEDDAVLARVDRPGGDVLEVQRAGAREVAEQIQAGLDVVERAAGDRVGHEEAAERRAGLRGLAVEGDRAGELRVRELVEGSDLTELRGVV